MVLLLALSIPSRSIQRGRVLHEQAYQAIRTAILSGELEAGDRLVETQLAEKFQVSRTPIREALRLLQQESLVVAGEGAALRVAQLSVQDASDLYDCRIALEQLAVAKACEHATAAQLKKIEVAVQKAEALSGKRTHTFLNHQLLDIDHQFHRLIADSSGNSWLVSMLDHLFDKMVLLRTRTMQQNPEVLEIQTEHRKIYEAIRDRNSLAAVSAIQDHLMASKERVIREVQEIDSRSGKGTTD